MSQFNPPRPGEPRTSSSGQWLAQQDDCSSGVLECFCLTDRCKKSGHRPVFPQRDSNDLDKAGIKPTEDFLAAELNKLSIQEMTKALDDVHCVGEELKENEDIIRLSLEEFDEHVKQAARNNVYYQLATIQNKDFVENETFRLKFLRARLYDAKTAVQQMLNFLKYKATYFGEGKLTKEITISDLDKDDLELFRSGAYSVQEDRDRSGRFVINILNHLVGRCSFASMIRVVYFIWYSLLVELPEVQLKGVAIVYHDTAKKGSKILRFGLQSYAEVMSAVTAVPHRITSLQLCLKAGQGLAINNAILKIATAAYPEHERVRTRIHYGSNMELQYTLQSLGFNLDTCPLDSRDEVRQNVLNAWYEKHLAYMQSRGFAIDGFVDKIQANSGGSSNNGREPVSTIRSTDILLGRGTAVQDHEGNTRFRNLLDGYTDTYNNTPRNKRRQIAKEISDMFRADGVRFLKLNKEKQWVEETDGAAVENKIGQFFRSSRKRNA